MRSVSEQMEHKQTMSHFLHTVKYDKKTTYLDPEEEKYWLHFLSRDPIIGDYIRSQIRANPQLRREILNQPVCPKCEGFMFFHKNGALCPSCGTFVPERSHTLKKHLREGYYK